jgi:hypothetical protein
LKKILDNFDCVNTVAMMFDCRCIEVVPDLQQSKNSSAVSEFPFCVILSANQIFLPAELSILDAVWQDDLRLFQVFCISSEYTILFQMSGLSGFLTLDNGAARVEGEYIGTYY